VIDAVARSRHLELVAPDGAMYAFPAVKLDAGASFDDHAFAEYLLEYGHVLLVPGTSFNIADTRHFRLTLLPEGPRLAAAVATMDELLDEFLA
jgi:alanine-synthesizing transaminase